MSTLKLKRIPLLTLLMMLAMPKTAVAKVRIVEHGYEGVIVAINPDIKPNEDILHRLEVYLTDTSAALFNATRKQIYFREFIIVVPEDWPSKQTYENALDVELDRAQLIVDRPNPAYGDAPYVKQYAKCGSPGLYVHLTPGYLLDKSIVKKWGKPEKTLVHEWAHLRWGVFDEYKIDPQDDDFYRYNGYWHPTRCSEQVEGSILNEYTSKPCHFDFLTGKPERNCRFFPRMAANKAASSIMFMQYLESVTEFCDDPMRAPKHLRHNYLAPNRQNRLCHYKSAWEVMRKHKDFSSMKKQLPEDTDTRPRFRYVQAHPRKRVLVLDTSGSMEGTSLSVLKQAASNYILSCIEPGSRLGIVHFSNKASTLSDLVEVKSENDRFSLIDALPTSAIGRTSIGSGLQKAVEVLTKNGSAPGGSIILITDGNENVPPYLEDSLPRVINKGIVVHSLAYGSNADKKIANLSQVTGGKTFFYNQRVNSTALIDGLAATVATENSVFSHTDVPHSILTDAGSVTKNNPIDGQFYIDSTLGRDTSLTFSYTNHIRVEIQGPAPNSVSFNPEKHKDIFRYNTPSRVLKVIIPGIATVGEWRYRVMTSADKSHITINIQSKAVKKGQEVLQVNSWIPEEVEVGYSPKQTVGVFAEVSRGKAPVLDAKVIAFVERPHADDLQLQLQDNGVGADIIKADGVYSANIIARDLVGNGRYNIKVKVAGIEGQTKVIVGGSGRASGAIEIQRPERPTDLQTAKLENFQRIASAGAFRLKGYVPKDKKTVIDVDEIPPSRITDLRITSFDYDKFVASLEWTAVGDDMERGKASKYSIIISDNFGDLVQVDQITTFPTTTESVIQSSPLSTATTLPSSTPTPGQHTTSPSEELLQQHSTILILAQEHVLVGKLEAPQESGLTERFTLHLDPNAIAVSRTLLDLQTVFLGVRASDAVGNHGEMSNIVSLSPAPDVAVPRQESVPVQKVGISLNTYLAFILPVSLVVLLSLIMCMIFLIMRARKCRSEEISKVPDLGHMNYMFQGEYRKRYPEELDSWSKESV